MKLIGYIIAVTIVILLYFLPLFFVFFGPFDELVTLLISFGLLILLSIVNLKEFIEKVRNIPTFNVRFTRGLVYCLCGLPFLISLKNRPTDYPFLGWLVILYLLILIIAIFNYGLKVKKEK